MSNIAITMTETKVKVVSPYNAVFVARARELAGSWDADAGAWVFDRRDGDRIRALCREVYGDDGLTTDTCTVRVTFSPGEYADRGPLTLHGRVVAKAWGRDSGAKLGDGVVLLDGGFGSGGSVNNWKTRAGAKGAVVLLRDFPRAAVDEYEDVIIEPETAPVDRDALTAERDRLVARLAEIDALLASGAAS